MSGLSAHDLSEKWAVSATGLHVRRCENCGRNTTRRNKRINGKVRYECRPCDWYILDFPPGHNRSTAEPLPLFALMAEPELTPLPELTPFIPKEKKDYADQVTRWQAERDGWIEPEPRVSTPAPVEQKPLASAQAQDDIAAFFPANVEPTEWLRVDAVAAGFGYGGEEPCDSCNASILACKREFRIKYLDPFGGGKWYKRCGANTYYSRQLIEAFSAYRPRVFDWDAAIAVSPIVDAPPQTKARRSSPIKSQVTEAIQPASSEPSHGMNPDSMAIVNTPRSALQPEHREASHGIDPNIAPTIAEFAKAVELGDLPAPDVTIPCDGTAMSLTLYRASTLSLFKTGGLNPNDFTAYFADSDSRIDLPVEEIISSTGLPPELSALAKYRDVQFYRVLGATDHRLGIGIIVGGRSRDKGTLRYVLAQHGFIMKPSERHLVPAYLALDYLGQARDNKPVASKVKGMKDRGLERQLNSEAQRLEDPAVGSDGMKAALPPQFDPEVKQAWLDQAAYSKQIAINTTQPVANKPHIHEYSGLAKSIQQINESVSDRGLPRVFLDDGQPLWRVWDGTPAKGSLPGIYLILTDLHQQGMWIQLFSIGEFGPGTARLSSSHERIKMIVKKRLPCRVLYCFIDDSRYRNANHRRDDLEKPLQKALKTTWEHQYDEESRNAFKSELPLLTL